MPMRDFKLWVCFLATARLGVIFPVTGIANPDFVLAPPAETQKYQVPGIQTVPTL